MESLARTAIKAFDHLFWYLIPKNSSVFRYEMNETVFPY